MVDSEFAAACFGFWYSFLMVDSECYLVALIVFCVPLIGLAVLYSWMPAVVIICACILPGLGLLLMVDS